MNTETASAKPRVHVPWIDTLKGIGISLVVLGHIRSNGPVTFFIYVFHMPLFFFMSGYLHRVESRIGLYARKKSIHLLVPYTSFVIAVTLLRVPHFFRHAVTLHRLGHAAFLLLWGGAELKGTYGVLWFLTCLFITQQLMNWLLSRFALGTVFAITGVGLVLAYVNSIFCPRFTLPWDANVALPAAAFFLAGYVMRKSDMLRPGYVLVSVLSAVIAAWLVVRGTPVYFDLKDAGFGIPVLSIALGLGCILGCVQIARLLPAGFRGTKMLQRIGLLSLPIMFIHRVLLSGPTAQEIRRYGTAVAFLLALGASWAVSEVMDRYSVTRALIFGSAPDFKALTRLEAEVSQPAELAASGSAR
jgi:fucose 4-O-acetylase-like acetyltransferase